MIKRYQEGYLDGSGKSWEKIKFKCKKAFEKRYAEELKNAGIRIAKRAKRTARKKTSKTTRVSRRASNSRARNT